MGSIKRKLILSIVSTALTVVCLTSTTYAWFARNSEAWTEDFKLDVESYDNLLISIDGENYRSSIGSDSIKRAIVAKANGINILEDSELEQPILTNEYVNTEFNKFKIRDVSTSDLVNFTTVEDTKGTNGYFDIKSASVYDYVAFDLYFRVDASKTATKQYDLTFVSPNHNEESESKVPVSYINAPNAQCKIQHGFVLGTEYYKAGQMVGVNLKNAMRIGVIHDSTVTDSQYTIYEPYEGLGSYAINGGEGIYSPDNNIMIQHLNAYGKFDLAPLEDVIVNEKSVYQNTQKNFDGEVPFATFTPVVKEDGSTPTEYNDVKITVVIWLEGYDADYLAAVDVTDLTCFFSFCKKERASE